MQTKTRSHSESKDERKTMKNAAGKVILFTGTTPNIGTTVIAFGTALQLAKRTDRTLAYICFNLKSSKLHQYIGIDHPPIALDQIRTDLKTETLTTDRLVQMLRPVKGVPNLHVLFGNQLREQAEYYSPEDIRHLLEIAVQAYDGCFVDVNAYWDNAATIVTALEADLKLIVTRSHRTYFQEDLKKWLLTGCAMTDMDPQSFQLFISQHGENGYSMQDIRKETGLQVIGRMNRYSKLESYVDQGDLYTFFESEPQAVRDLDPIRKWIQSACQWTEKPIVREKKKWLRKIWPAIHS